MINEILTEAHESAVLDTDEQITVIYEVLDELKNSEHSLPWRAFSYLIVLPFMISVGLAKATKEFFTGVRYVSTFSLTVFGMGLAAIRDKVCK